MNESTSRPDQKRRLLPWLALAAAIAAGIAVAAQAFPGHRGMMHGPGPMGALGPERIMQLAERLDLDSEQRDRIGAIMDERFPQFRKSLFALAESRRALKDMAGTDAFDATEARRHADVIGEQVAQMSFLAASSLAEMRELLTPEQRAELDRLREQRRGMRHHMRHRMGALPGAEFGGAAATGEDATFPVP